MNSTWLTRQVEAELFGRYGISLSVYLHTKKAAGWTILDIQADLEERTDIRVSDNSLIRWTGRLAYSSKAIAAQAWRHGRVPQVEIVERMTPAKVTRLRASSG